MFSASHMKVEPSLSPNDPHKDPYFHSFRQMGGESRWTVGLLQPMEWQVEEGERRNDLMPHTCSSRLQLHISFSITRDCFAEDVAESY